MRKNWKNFAFAGAVVLMWISAAFPVLAYDGDVYWDNMTACWDDTNDAKRYQVQLYRGTEKIASRSTTGISYNFTGDITQTGNYRFRVREYVDGSYANWSAYSDYISVRVDNKKNTNQNSSSTNISSDLSINLNIGSQSSNDKNSSASAKAQQRNREVELNKLEKTPYREGWQKENERWWYQLSDGSRIKDKFQYLDGTWYNFDENGYIRTGWYQRGSVWFYLKPDGAMVTGWEQINQKWYYFDESSGFMLADTTTPDGYRVGADGAMIQN